MGAGKSFAETDSWAVALSFLIFAGVSVLIERLVGLGCECAHSRPGSCRSSVYVDRTMRVFTPGGCHSVAYVDYTGCSSIGCVLNAK
jgi:hypothetical protein